ncbi:Translation factor GUF1, mitochondrial [Oopsacas minuta]|uniref:Translation factor GUF1 homolog, mitochondrial n=1 Tax=Oopsacas minuta TaxID=111878 RepID=A0AAV7K840_9METZ|nr:Translation factor GUF1, mitochondrial [Oopsacas minuta]
MFIAGYYMRISLKPRYNLIRLISPFLLIVSPNLACPSFTLSYFLSLMAVADPLSHVHLPSTHIKARCLVYPGRAADDPTRTSVPDDKVSWKVEWSDYKPIQYTAPPVLKGPVWADPDLMAPDNTAKINTFNQIDGKTETIELNLERFTPDRIRNFCIIAHVDHGKSTLADRLLEITHTIPSGTNNKQVLDRLKVERDRGITVKAQTASMLHSFGGKEYLLNLIDTPGHVDFSYEVSRSLAACQGALLVIDAQQGVQAQTVANFLLSQESGITVIPVLNKIDMKSADVDSCLEEVTNMLGVIPDHVFPCSAKIGTGVDKLLPAILELVPPPMAYRNAPLKAILIDSWFEKFSGVICQIAVLDGSVAQGDAVSFLQTGCQYEVQRVGVLRPNKIPASRLFAGQVGYLIVPMKQVKEAKMGDTLCHTSKKSSMQPLPGFKPMQPMVFCGLYPESIDQLIELETALDKLTLNDPSVTVEHEQSDAMGRGWRIGFLGRLHLEVFLQRLEEEFNTSVIVTSPSVPYRAIIKSGNKRVEIVVTRPSEFPESNTIISVSEPTVLATLIFPSECMGMLIDLCLQRRGKQQHLSFLSEERAMLKFFLPLSEVITDFFGRVKALTRGYGTFDYEDAGYQESDIVKLDILLNKKRVDAISALEHRNRAEQRGKAMCKELARSLPRQQFQIAIQAAYDGRVFARQNIPPYRKNVTAKLHAADPSRHKRLLERQREGKRLLREIGNIPIDRHSHNGPYNVVDCLPRNPVGRTGLTGRGLLGRWGPNHAADPIVTRWKRSPTGEKMVREEKGVLEFVGIKRKDSGEWAIPGGMVEAGDTVSATLKKEFGEEAMNSLEASVDEKKKIEQQISNLFKDQGLHIYAGYVDDPRNTDNAWMETVAVNFHDDTGEAFNRVKLQAGDDAGAVTWIEINKQLQLYASHVEFIRTVAEKRGAAV